MTPTYYSDIRNLISSGDIIFLKTNTLAGKIIRFFTNSPYTHVCMAFWIHSNSSVSRLLVVEAQGGTRRRIINLSDYIKYDWTIINNLGDWSSQEPEALDKLGNVSYGWINASYFGIRQFLLKTLRIKLPRKSFSGEICSEFVANILKLEESRVTPSELFDVLTKEKGHKIKFDILHQ